MDLHAVLIRAMTAWLAVVSIGCVCMLVIV
jgi:hypothetical protein